MSGAVNSTVISVPQRKMRFFWSDNATRPIACGNGEIIYFQRLEQRSGLWKGYHCTTDPIEIEAILTAAREMNGLLREISPEEFQERTKIEQETWKVEDYMPEPAVVENLVPERLPEKCFRTGRIIHCVERHKQKDDEALRRVQFAQESWTRLYMTGEVVPCHVWKYKRSAKELGDTRDLPFLKDVLAEGLNISRSDDDIILITNDDTVLHPDVAQAIYDFMEEVPAVCSGRTNYTYGTKPDFIVKKDADQWSNDIGRDLFAFRKEWLKKQWNAIPDFLLGEIEWDLVLSALIRLKVAKKKTTLADRIYRTIRCELPVGYVWHEDHVKGWTNMDLFYAPAKRHNIGLMQEWYRANKLEHLIQVT